MSVAWLQLLNTIGLLLIAVSNGVTAFIAWKVKNKVETVAETVAVSAPLIKETAAIVREQPSSSEVVRIVNGHTRI